MNYAREVKYAKATHEISSGLGGVFFVKIIEDMGEKVKVMCCNKFDGWYGKEWVIDKANLSNLAA